MESWDQTASFTKEWNARLTTFVFAGIDHWAHVARFPGLEPAHIGALALAQDTQKRMAALVWRAPDLDPWRAHEAWSNKAGSLLQRWGEAYWQLFLPTPVGEATATAAQPPRAADQPRANVTLELPFFAVNKAATPEIVENDNEAAENAPAPSPAPKAAFKSNNRAEAPASSPAPAIAPTPVEAAPADDLTLINGIGPKLAQALNGLGVFRFQDIADLSPADVERIDAALKFKGRIGRERWIEQAKRLAARGAAQA